ncbi:multidrug effflux MFS transporter [Pseudoprimorskyibacter insulae]|uniref:Bicyclomycin resistance protein n=1 Tax=Pseudoprimorskyibacter insulae TaxID=1695997 RepID=A0A2R8AYZ1_9RHOB|nr:multidrug effflux MFS transporter [Pseudoprimorskyibacter insulae]SPF81252.1 Bicyclomycin resistance protein [Pseudoprimorskyibacter insulae]
MPAQVSRLEFIAIMAMLFATIAFSIDSMLPALPEIAQELTPDNINNAQLVLTSFVLGMGVGTLFTGPMSDAWGRKPLVLGGAALYIVGSALAYYANTLELMLVSRVIQGLGAAGPRVVSLAITRDLYSGRAMARIMSFVMMVFTMVPALAPSIGAVVIAFAGWRAIFIAFILFSALSCLWLGLRMPETLARENRVKFRFSTLKHACQDMASRPVVVWSIIAQSIGFSLIFAMISSVQQIYDVIFDKADSFPLYFGAIAIISATSSMINAALVMRLGMRAIVTFVFAAQLVISTVTLIVALSGVGIGTLFVVFLIWQTSVFFTAGLTMGNLNAITMEPLGHIAGSAASVIGAVSTVIAVLLAAPIGLMFDGTLIPITASYAVLALAGVLVMRHVTRVSDPIPAE